MKMVLFCISFVYFANLTFASPPQNDQNNEPNNPSPTQEDESYIKSLISELNSLMSKIKNYFSDKEDLKHSEAPYLLLPDKKMVIKPKPKSYLPPPLPMKPLLPNKKMATFMPAKPLPPEPVDKKAQKMATCFSDIQEILTNRTKKKMHVYNNVPFENITCSYGLWPANNSIWHSKYPTEAFCHDNRKPILPSPPNSYMDIKYPKVTEEQKSTKLNQCFRHLEALKAGKNPLLPIVRPIDTLEQQMANCLRNMQIALNSNKRKKLIAQGVPYEHIICKGRSWAADNCIWAASYPTQGFCTDTRRPEALGSGLASCLSYIPTDRAKRNKLNLCRQHLAKLKAPPSNSLTWNDCMKNTLKEQEKSLKEYFVKATIASFENINCMGYYGSNKGYKVSCSSTDPKISMSTKYKPYPENCQALRSISANEGSGQR